jgi:hypothetical protein
LNLTSISASPRAASASPPNDREEYLVNINDAQGQSLTGFDSLRDGSFDERARRFNLSEQPFCDGEHDLALAPESWLKWNTTPWIKRQDSAPIWNGTARLQSGHCLIWAARWKRPPSDW